MPDLPSLLQAGLGGAYVLDRELGRGGMAVVFLAEDRKHGRRVALKVIRPDIAAVLGTDRFLREIQVVSRLTHPLIVPLLDSGEAGGLPFFVMPYLEGPSLRQRMDKEGGLPLADALHIAGEIADALGAAHDAGIVHRDVKPENILFAGRHVQVSDFGIAKAMSVAGGERLSQTGLGAGTPAYMSPEQAMGELEVDGRSDIYSLGIVVYEMLSGAIPFAGSTVQALIAKRLIEAVPSLRSVSGETIPGHVDAALTRALARSPADRFATIGEFAAALGEAGFEGGAATPTAAVSPSSLGRSHDRIGSAKAYIAVAPFVNMSSDPENEYFSDGMTEELINALAQIRSLRVVGRASSFAFKGRDLDVRTMGEALNVDAVLTGSVRRAAGRIRVAAQLVNVEDGFALWSERFDRDQNDIFAVQDEIAGAIVETLRTTLLPGLGGSAQTRHARDFEAYELYLRGRYFWSQRGTGLGRGLDCFRRALAVDPDYALAHAGVADSHTLLAYYGFVPPGEAFPKAKAAALRALAIDDSVAEAHGSLAYIYMYWDRMIDDARHELQRAIDLNPAYVPARYWLAAYHMSQGRLEDAIAEDRDAVEIDPLSPFLNAHLGWMYYIARRPGEAVPWLEKASDLDPAFLIARRLLGVCRLAEDRVEEALAALDEAVTRSGRDPWLLSDLGAVLVAAGRRPEAEALLAEIRTRAASSHVPATHVAALLAALGRREEAIETLGRAVRDREPSLVFDLLEPHWDAIRADPEFAALAQTVGLVARAEG